VTDIVWLERQALELLHAEAIADHGGLPGLRDEGLLESALARPKNLHAYEGVTDIPSLAACHGVAIAKNHPFNDGNKRIAFIAAILFTEKNGFRVVADQADAATIMLAVAAGDVDQDALAAWLRQHARPQP
jgi:death-on-curing protein